MNEPGSPDEALPRSPRRRRLWPLALMVATLVGAAVAIVVFLGRRPDPLRVLVAIDVQGLWWRGSAASAVLSSSLATRLERLGFDAVGPGDPEVIAALEREQSPEAAARRVRASFVVSGTLTPELEDHGGAGGQITARASGPVALGHHLDGPLELERVVGWASGKSKDEALRALGESLGDPAFDQVVPALIEHPAVKSILEHGDAAEKGRLSRAKSYVEQRRLKLDGARRAYDELLAERAPAERGGARVTYYGPIDRNAGLCAGAALGMLIKTDQVKPFFSPDSRQLVHLLEPERVAWLLPDGKERAVLESYGFHGYASAAAAGAPLVVVEDLFGWGRAVTLVEAGGPKRRLRVDVKGWPSDPKVAPGGGLVALWERACRGCPAAIVVLGLPKGEERHRSDARTAALGGFAWLDTRRLVVLERGPAKPVEKEPRAGAPRRPSDKPPLIAQPWPEKPAFTQTLTIVDFARQPPSREPLYEAGDESLSALASSADGRFLAMARRAPDAKELGVLDVHARSLSAFTALAADNPSLSAQGDFIAFERGGDIAVLERATGTTRVLTNNPFYERYPLFSADGSRVFFESRAEDPNFPRRTLSVIASVAVR